MSETVSRTTDLTFVENAVHATVYFLDRKGTRIGSGFLVDSRGLIVTAGHVVAFGPERTERRIRVELWDGHKYWATVFMADAKLDFALLWLRGKHDLPTMPLGDPLRLRFGETVYVVGCPKGMKSTVSRGIVSNPRQMVDGIGFIQTDAAIYYGNSGGPIFNRRGAVGFVSRGLGTPSGGPIDNLHFGVPLDHVQDHIRKALDLGKTTCLRGQYCRYCGSLGVGPRRHECPTCNRELGAADRRARSQGELLDECNPHAREIFSRMIERWTAAGHQAVPAVGGISLKAKVAGKLLGLLSLRAPLRPPRTPGLPLIISIWGGPLARFQPSAAEAYVCSVKRLRPLKLTPTTVHLEITPDFTRRKADGFIRSVMGLVSGPAALE